MALKDRCFFFPPRLVSCVTGIIGLIAWVIILIVTVVLAIQLYQETSNLESIKPDHLALKLIFVSAAFLFFFAVLVIAITNCIVSSLLIVAYAKSSKYFVLPWLVWNAIQICYFFIVFVVNIVSEPEELIWWFLLPVYGCYIYLWVYVLEYYKSLLQGINPSE